MLEETLQNRKFKLESRLEEFGIKESYVDYIKYFEFDDNNFVDAYEVGCRIIILNSVNYVAQNLGDRSAIRKWLKKQNLSEYITPRENELFNGKIKEKQ
jgi:hypothetical protein